MEAAKAEAAKASEELAVAVARVATLEAEVAELTKAKGEVEARLDQFRKAATHWKAQFTNLKSSAAGSSSAAPAASE